jgi:hypothetical protein
MGPIVGRPNTLTFGIYKFGNSRNPQKKFQLISNRVLKELP